MPENTAAIEIPDRALFKAAEVCDLVKVQPYVLRSWEAEFPELGVAKTTGAARVYRRADVEQVVRIKHLLVVEGLTLAGARKKLTEDTAPIAADAPVLDELLGRHARERLTEVKRGLRSILDLLSASPLPLAADFRPLAPSARMRSTSHPPTSRRSAKPPRTKVAASRSNARRKRA